MLVASLKVQADSLPEVAVAAGSPLALEVVAVDCPPEVTAGNLPGLAAADSLLVAGSQAVRVVPQPLQIPNVK